MKNPFKSGKQEIIENGTDETKKYEADFETAISATGFGKFNWILLLIAIPCGWAAMFDSNAMSYVVPVAYCDLDLNLEERGMLNGIAYLGMICSAFIWGFLADTLGRKKLLIIGYAIDACFVIIAGFSQSYEMLLVAKFMTGFIINGPFAALTSMLSEFHAAKYRAKMILLVGIIFGLANIALPLLAWVVMPKDWDFSFFDGKLNLHSWNFFILISAIPSIVSSILNCFVPESPKFLMTVGRNEEALKVFQKVYSTNTGNPPDSFPFKTLVDEIKERSVGKHGGVITANRSAVQALKEGWQQITPLFFPPHLLNLILVCVMQIGFMAGVNTIRLWLPQIFTAINDYKALYPNEDASLCQMLDIIIPSENVTISDCIVNNSRDMVYINVLIVATVTIVAYSVAGGIINNVGKKSVIIMLASIGGISGFCIYFAQNIETTTGLAAINNALLGVACNVQLSVVVDLFPTSLRTIAISLVLMIGRIGGMSGNIVFPVLLQIGCLYPFLMIGGLVIACVFLTFFLPKTDMKALD